MSKVDTNSTVTAEIFSSLISDLLSIMDQDQNLAGSWILMDNARIHRPDILNAMITQRGYILQFLSPYSYMLNPVEFVFSKIKNLVRNELTRQFNIRSINLGRLYK